MVKKVEQNKKATQLIRGRVVSAKMPKTVTVLVEETKVHPLYKKSYKASKKFLAHDEKGVKEGDIVELIKVRPLSAHKHWQIVSVVGHDLEAIVTQELKTEAAEAIAEVLPEEPEATEEAAAETEEKK